MVLHVDMVATAPRATAVHVDEMEWETRAADGACDPWMRSYIERCMDNHSLRQGYGLGALLADVCSPPPASPPISSYRWSTNSANLVAAK